MDKYYRKEIYTKEELESIVRENSDAYYKGLPCISDAEFDAIWDALRVNYPESTLLREIGDDKLDGEKIKHGIHMGSQEKITTLEEFNKWVINKDIDFPLVAQRKVDGISVELVYQDGKFKDAITRGNGIEGTSIFKNIKLIDSLPKTIDTNSKTFIRGEIILPFSKIPQLKGYEDRDVLSTRNIAAGIAVQKNSIKNCELLDIIVYDVLIEDSVFASEARKLRFLQDNSFNVVPFDILEREEVIRRIIASKKEDFSDIDYAIDGIVLKTVKVIDSEKARPDNQRAFKWSSEEKNTDIIRIEWSRNGYNYTPVAILKPVELSDTMVSRASLANIAEIKRLKLKKLPSLVTVTKRGEIIPKVISVVEEGEDSEPFEIIERCLICGEKLEVKDTSIKCTNLRCKSYLEHRLKKWFKTLGIVGVGEAMISHMVFSGIITCLSDLYLEEIREELIKSTNTVKVFEKLFVELDKNNEIKLAQLISGLDLEGFGEKIIQLIVDAGFDTLSKVISTSKADLLNIEGFSEKRTNAFINYKPFISSEANGILMNSSVKIKDGIPLETKEKKVFCITGKLSKPRKELEGLIEDKGHKFSKSVTKNTNYLVNNNINSTSSKNVKAKKLGIEIISEEELIILLEE